MFVADPGIALQRLYALLRPGGRISVATWCPPETNPAFAIPSEQLRKVAESTSVDPTAPGPFRLSGAGELAAAAVMNI